MTAVAQLELPNWLMPQWSASPLTSVELARLKRENQAISYDNALEGILSTMVENHTTWSYAVKQDPRGFDPAHYLAWVMKDEARKMKYYAAQGLTAELVFDDILRIADADDMLEDVNRSTLKISARKWWLAVVNRKRFGETRQVENNITIDLGEAMAAAQARASARDVIDVVAKEIGR